MSALSGALLLGLCATLVAQDRPPAPASPHAFLAVLDRNGAPVADLDPSQVSMTLDGVACASITLQPIDWPVKLSVLVDNSGASMESLAMLREGLRRFLFEVPEGVDTSLLTLAPQPRWIVRPTAERRDFWQGIDRVIPDRGAAKFLEALAEAADRIDRETGDVFSTIMVVTTNGLENSGGDLQRTFDRLRAKLAARPVVVHVMMLAISEQRASTASVGESIAPGLPTTSRQFAQPGPNTINPGQPLPAVASLPSSVALRPSGALQTQVGLALTKDTGGRYETVAVASSLPTLLPEFSRQIARSYALQKTQYRVSCESSQTSKVRQLSVFTTYPGSRGIILSRDGRIP